jgi:hypothetical protein
MNALSLETNAEGSVPLAALPPLSLDEFMRQTGLSPVTCWRYRKKGWLETIIIAGRHYVTRESIVKFNRRAEAGEFAGVVSNPSSRKVRKAAV